LARFRPESKIYLGCLIRPESKIYLGRCPESSINLGHLFIHYWLFLNDFYEHLYPEKALDFYNMLCSCQNKLKKGEPRHCGNLKGDDELPISPLDEDCERYFK